MMVFNTIQERWWQYCDSLPALYVLGVIVGSRNSRYIWGQERLAADAHCSLRSLQRHLKALTDAGLITTDGRTFGEVAYLPTNLAVTVAESTAKNGGKHTPKMAESTAKNGGKSPINTNNKTNTDTNTEQIPPLPPFGEVRDRYGRVLEVWVETYRRNVGKDYIDTFSVTNDLKKLIGKVATAMYKANVNAGIKEQEAHPTDDEVVETMRGFFLSAYKKGGKLTQDNWDIAYINRYFQKLFVITDNNTTNYEQKYSEERIERLRRAGFIR